jgi:hypothetical protein
VSFLSVTQDHTPFCQHAHSYSMIVEGNNVFALHKTAHFGLLFDLKLHTVQHTFETIHGPAVSLGADKDLCVLDANKTLSLFSSWLTCTVKPPACQQALVLSHAALRSNIQSLWTDTNSQPRPLHGVVSNLLIPLSLLCHQSQIQQFRSPPTSAEPSKPKRTYIPVSVVVSPTPFVEVTYERYSVELSFYASDPVSQGFFRCM